MKIPACLVVACAVQIYAQGENQTPEKNSRAGAIVIANGLEQFYINYYRLPGRAGPDAQTTTSGENDLVRILMGKEEQDGQKQNPRNTNFLEGIRNAKPGSNTLPVSPGRSNRWVDGLIVEKTMCGMVDGWGNYYNVRLDSDFDLQIANPNPGDGGRAKLSKRAIVWSAGKDGNIETWEDNVKSWD